MVTMPIHHPWDRPPEQLSEWQCTHQQLRHTQEPCTRMPLAMHVDTTSATASPAGEAILGSPGHHFQAKPSCLPAGICHCVGMIDNERMSVCLYVCVHVFMYQQKWAPVCVWVGGQLIVCVCVCVCVNVCDSRGSHVWMDVCVSS